MIPPVAQSALGATDPLDAMTRWVECVHSIHAVFMQYFQVPFSCFSCSLKKDLNKNHLTVAGFQPKPKKVTLTMNLG